MFNEIKTLILKVNGKIQSLRDDQEMDPEDRDTAIAHLEKAKEGLREAKFYIGQAYTVGMDD